MIAAKDEERKILVQKYDQTIELMTEAQKTESEKFKIQLEEMMKQRKVIEDGFIDQAQNYDKRFQQMNAMVTESQNTISKYKKEMGEITKFVKKLHGESSKSKDTIKTLQTERIKLMEANEILKKKQKTLENLCRRLQIERKTLVTICKNNGLGEEVERQLAAAENESPFEMDDGKPTVGKSIENDKALSEKPGEEADKTEVDDSFVSCIDS